MTNILTPITEPYPLEVGKVLERYPRRDGYILQVFRVFANSLRFLNKGMPNLLDEESPLSLRLRKIVILRVTANRNCQYEWGVHVSIFANSAGLTEEQIADTRRVYLKSDGWTDAEKVLIAAIDQLCSSGELDGLTLAQFRSEYTKEEQLEVCALAGAYHTVSFVANIAQIEDEFFGAKFPS